MLERQASFLLSPQSSALITYLITPDAEPFSQTKERKKMKPLKLAVVQFTPEFGEKQKNLSRMQQLVEEVTADIILFPELCTTGYFFQSRHEAARAAETVSGPSSEFFQDMARDKSAVVVAGFAERHQKHLYNACLIVVPEAKTHMFIAKRTSFIRKKIALTRETPVFSSLRIKSAMSVSGRWSAMTGGFPNRPGC
jgi:hypothetical protein